MIMEKINKNSFVTTVLKSFKKHKQDDWWLIILFNNGSTELMKLDKEEHNNLSTVIKSIFEKLSKDALKI